MKPVSARGSPCSIPSTAMGVLPMKSPSSRDFWFKDADKEITRNLKERGVLYKHVTYLHNYPHDWRKGTPLMSYPVESWFIRTTAVRGPHGRAQQHHQLETGQPPEPVALAPGWRTTLTGYFPSALLGNPHSHLGQRQKPGIHRSNRQCGRAPRQSRIKKKGRRN